MRSSFILSMLCLTGVSFFVVSAAAQMAPQQGPRTGRPVSAAPTQDSANPNRPTKASGENRVTSKQLTEAECSGLGGTVRVDKKNCKTGKACVTVNKDGVINGLCIDGKRN